MKTMEQTRGESYREDLATYNILLTVIVRLLVYPLTHHGLKLNAQTQMEMAKIKPELEKINER